MTGRPRRRRMFGAAAVVALAAVAVAGCGDDDEDGSATGSGSGSASGPAADGDAPPVSLDGETNDEGTGAVEDGAVEIELDDFYFGPTYIEAEPGSTVTIHLFNEGDAPHTFTIDEADVDEELEPGDTRDIQVTIPDAEVTTIYCRFHQAQGMQAAFFTP